MKKTRLLNLPNEVLLLIFEYLSPTDLVTSFIKMRSKRIQELLQPFISVLDISEENDEWIEKYLSDALVQRRITSLRLKDKKLRFISKYLSSDNIQSLEVISSGLQVKLSEDIRVKLRQYLKKLTITVSCLTKDEQLIDKLFPRNPNFKYFSSTGRFIYPIADHVYKFHSLTYLSIKLGTIHDVFIILHRLPTVQELNVYLKNPFYSRERITNVQNAIPCKKLRRVTLRGDTEYFYGFGKFFAAFGSTIESLILDIRIKWELADSLDLERDLLDKMPLLSSFDLFLTYFWLYGKGRFIDVKKFQSASWEKFNPIVCCNDIQKCSVICTLPFKFNYFDVQSNNCISSLAVNRPIPICFENVRSLWMCSRKPWWTTETFKFIQNAFPNVKTLYLWSQLSEMLHAYYEISPNERYPEIFSDDFLTNTIIQLPSVTKVSVKAEYYQYNNGTLRCLFHLLPNLSKIETSGMKSIFNDQEIGHHYDDFVKNMLNRIELSSPNSWIDLKYAKDPHCHYYFQEREY